MRINKYFNLLKVYTLSEVIAKGLNWLIMIILPQLISVENLGFIALIIAFENIIFPISLNGQHISVLRFFNRFKNYKESFFKSIYIVFVKWNILVIPIITIITFLLYNSFPFIIVIFAVPFIAIREIILSYLRVEEKKEKYFRIRVFYQILKFSFVIIFAKITPTSQYIYPLGLIIAILINIFQISLLLKSDLNYKKVINAKTRLTSIFFFFGFPIIFHSLSNAISMFINRYLIQYFIDQRSVGIFSVAYSLSFSLFFLVYIGSLVFQPLLYKRKRANNKSEIFLVLYTNSVFIFIAAASILLWFLQPYILLLYNVDYKESTDTFKILLLSILIIPFYHQGNFRITLKNKTLLLPLASGIAAIINIIFNILLIPRIGILGAAYSTLASNITIMLLTNVISYNFIKLRNFFSIIFITIGSILLFITKSFIEQIPWLIFIWIMIALIEIILINRPSLNENNS